MKIYTKGTKVITLGQKDFKASGGEGTIYCRGDLAYKIYQDPAKMIPPKKIEELRKIDLDNVLVPLEVIYQCSNDRPIGFTMNYISDTEFLCRAITTSFRQRHGITPAMTIELIENLRKTLEALHQRDILVVDFNEMNFLTDNHFSIPYFIDTNSYQTKNFPATALMDSVRDRQAPPGKFSPGTDWFSFAVVAFQLYLGCHPYKGKHPSYTAKERAALKMMDDNISLFHDGVLLPAGTRDWGEIPGAHFDWFRQIFLNGARCAPPPAGDALTVAIPHIMTQADTDGFTVEKTARYDEPVISIIWHRGIRYVTTESCLYAGSNRLMTGNFRQGPAALTFADDGTPVLASFDPRKEEVTFTVEQGHVLTSLKARGLMACGSTLYTLSGTALLEHSFTSLGKILHGTREACEIFEPAFEIFPGMVTQNIMGRCWLALPWRPGNCANLPVSELDRHRIIDASFEPLPGGGIVILISEFEAMYYRSVIFFSRECSVYSIRIDSNSEPDIINFTVLSKGLIAAAAADGVFEAFYDNSTVKLFEDSPVDSSTKLFSDGTGVYFIQNQGLYRLKMNK